MSKKYTLKDMNRITKDMLANAFIHIESLVKELNKLNDSDKEKLNKDTQSKIGTINAMITLLNDTVHPAHNLAYKYFRDYHAMIDIYIKNQKLAVENKIIPECFNECCDADGSKSKARAEQLAAQEVKDEQAAT